MCHQGPLRNDRRLNQALGTWLPVSSDLSATLVESKSGQATWRNGHQLHLEEMHSPITLAFNLSIMHKSQRKSNYTEETVLLLLL